MSGELVSTVWDAVTAQVGDDLRVVTRFEATTFETRMRDDVRARYTEEDDREVVDDIIVEQLGLSETQAAFEAGTVRALVRVFDDAWVLAWPDRLPKKSGFIVSIQRDGTVASMDDVEWCIRYLDEEIAPRL